MQGDYQASICAPQDDALPRQLAVSARRKKRPKVRRQPPGSLRPALSVLAAKQVEGQRESNASSVAHRAAFASHREHTTRLLLERAAPDKRLCLLGAGNAYDVELAELMTAYSEVHLVDLDAAALQRAVQPLTEAQRARVKRHAPVDLSGMLDRLDAWRAMRLSEDQLIRFPGEVARRLRTVLGGPFEVVASLCLLTQLQLTLLDSLTDRHPLFSAIRFTLNVAHLRALSELAGEAGCGLLVSDVTSSEITQLPEQPTQSWLQLLADLMERGEVIDAVRPDLLAGLALEDPVLQQWGTLSPPLDAWLWRAGPQRRFLVYAAELLPRSPRG